MKQKKADPMARKAPANRDSTSGTPQGASSGPKSPKPIPRLKAGDVTRSTARRYYRILEMINRGTYPNSSDFMQELNMGSRSVTRDIAYLQDIYGLPIAYCPTHKGFYFTEPITHFPALFIGASEIIALQLARRALERTGNAAFLKHLDSAFEKLGIVMNDDIKALWEKISSRITFRTSTPEVLTDFAVFKEVYEALRDEVVLEFEYKSYSTKPGQPLKRRRLCPLHLLSVDSDWYLFPSDPTAENPEARQFSLSRMTKVEGTSQPFTSPANCDPKELLANSIGVYSGEKAESLHVRLRGRSVIWFSDRRFHKSQKFVENPDGTADLTMRVAITPELERLFLGWGSQAEVLAPQSLRQTIHDNALEIIQRGV